MGGLQFCVEVTPLNQQSRVKKNRLAKIMTKVGVTKQTSKETNKQTNKQANKQTERFGEIWEAY